MFLQRLCELRDRLRNLPPLHHEEKGVYWQIELGNGGEFKGWSKLGEKKGLPLVIPYRGRSGSNPPPLLLVDNQIFVLGKSPKGKKISEKSLQKRHQAFISLIRDLQESIQNELVQAVLNFLEGEGVQEALKDLPESLKGMHLISFSVEGVRPQEAPGVSEFWIQRRDSEISKQCDSEGLCALCGEEKGIPSSTSMGIPFGGSRCKIVSANANAFESYGMKRSQIFPACSSCSMKYGEALRYLLTSEEGKNNRYRVGDVTYLFWTREEIEFDLDSLLKNPDSETVKNLFRNPFRGKGGESTEPNDFYAVALSNNMTRFVVRSYLEIPLRKVEESLCKWYKSQTLFDSRLKGPAEPYGLSYLASSLVPMKTANDGKQRPNFEKLPPQIMPMMFNAALFGKPLSTWVLTQAVRRNYIERKLTRQRTALIKMILSQISGGDAVTEELDLSSRNPGYLCGRLFAALEYIQKSALGDINTTIVDKYYGTVSTAPMSIFPFLIRGSKAHLKKVRGGNRGREAFLDRLLSDIQVHLQEFPRVLSMNGQAYFSLGYYHQKADLYRSKKTTDIETETEIPGDSNND